MDKLREMQSFAAVVTAGSFVAAADALGTSKAAVSRHVAELEERLGARLLNRTTRSLSLTDEGEIFFQHCIDILSAVEEAESELNSRRGQASGILRISAPVTFGNLHLAPLWGTFLAQHPQLEMEVSLSDREVDLVEEGYDLAIRISRNPQPHLIGRRLASTRTVLCASPQYLKRKSVPRHPRELSQHEVISYTYWSLRDEWQFEGPQGTASVKTHPRLRANSGDTCRAAALRHQGIILQPAFLVEADLRAGALQEILPAYKAPELGIFAVYASRKHLPLKLRFLIDFLVEAFREPAW